MIRYLLSRLAQAILVLWAAFTLSFVILYALPGDPVAIMTGAGTGQSTVDPAQVEALRHQLGLDKPVPLQYWDRLVAALHGDLGQSVTNGQTVFSVIGQNLPSTLLLTSLALVVAVILGGGLAMLATYTRLSALRQVLLSLPSFGVSVPTFWIGLLLVQLFSFRVHLFPAFGNGGPVSLVLPVITLAVPCSAIIAQLLARSMDTALAEPYIETARAKGAGRVRIHLRHALRNAIGPSLTMLALIFGELITNAVVVETVFSRQDLGSVTAAAAQAENIPIVQGVVLVSATIYAVVNLVVDVIYPLIDPRIVTRRSTRVSAPAVTVSA